MSEAKNDSFGRLFPVGGLAGFGVQRPLRWQICGEPEGQHMAGNRLMLIGGANAVLFSLPSFAFLERQWCLCCCSARRHSNVCLGVRFFHYERENIGLTPARGVFEVGLFKLFGFDASI